MPPPGLQIYLRPHVTLTFDLTSPEMFLPRGSRHSEWHENRFIRFQNIAFTSLVTDGRTDRRPKERTS